MNLTVKNIAHLLNISEKTIYRMIKNETIPCFRIGGQWRFDKQEIVSWIEDSRDFPQRTATRHPYIEDEEGISISEFLKRGGVYYHVVGNAKEAAILSCLTLIRAGTSQKDIQRLFDALMEREKLCSTAVGHGIAFPHPRPFKEFIVPISAISLCFLEQPVPFEALDNENVDTLFFIFPRSEKRYLRILAKLSRMLKDEEVIAAVRKTLPKDELLQVFSGREAEIFRESAA